MIDQINSKPQSSHLNESMNDSVVPNPISHSNKNKMKLPKSKKLSPKMILGAVILILTMVGATAGYFLTQTSQDVRQQAAEEPYDQVCCTFNGGQTYSKADQGICQGNGSQVSDSFCSNTGSGTQSCPNGQTHLSRTCSGNSTRTCINGQYSIADCSSGYTCYQGNCLLDSAEASCAGDVPDGATACLTDETEVTCNNGEFVSPVNCTSPATCVQGRCQAIIGDPGVANCDPNETNQNDPDFCGIYGTGTCESNNWNVYECDSINTSGGCSDRRIGTTTNSGVNGYLASTPGCKTRQADCVGGGYEFKSRVNNTGSCAEEPLPPVVSTAACNEACSSTVTCANSGHTCTNNVCRLTTNPGSPTCEPPVGGPIVSPTPNTSSSPNPSPTPPNNNNYFCNSTCSSTSQCQTADDDFICSAVEGNRCRLDTNPTSAECQPPVGPMCLSLSLTNVSNPEAGATDDPELGDAVSFTCGLVNGADHYIFRVIEPDQTIVDLSATGATSSQYTITKDGAHAAQCQICTGANENTCHAYEDPFN